MNYRDKTIRELKLYNSEAAPDGFIWIHGYWYPFSITQELYEIIHMDYKAILMYGPPGGGKTHLARKLIPVLLKKIVGKEVRTYYSNLGDYVNNMTDFKYYPILKDNTMYYVKSELVKLNEASTDAGFVVNNIFDEVSRISNDAQNQLLPILPEA